jgi:hypothetical protein
MYLYIYLLKIRVAPKKNKQSNLPAPKDDEEKLEDLSKFKKVEKMSEPTIKELMGMITNKK